MATLVFSTVGTVLGGPVGGAIGALIGQSIDQQVLGPASRGPKLGDLSVQTSSYGTQIPRVYGTMRVAGSVVWATDLVQSEQTSGAKGQPDLTYSYKVSFAVALSSRPAGAIGRIWADGKLLRGAEGDFKVTTTFRFYDGSEDQAADPLIASIEGIGLTPAYRGLALAVFEDLELAEYGNRIPFLTFEVMADSEPPTIGAVLADASSGTISSDSAIEVTGYAAYGRSVRVAIEPLVDCHAIELFDDGTQVRGPVTEAPAILASDELGNSVDGDWKPRTERDQQPVQQLPAVLRLSYYDPDRDFQAGEARASAGEADGAEVQQELAAVLRADAAKALVQQMLAAAWAKRDRLTLRLAPGQLAIEPGSRVQVDVTPASWIVDSCTIDGLVTIAELYPAWVAAAPIAADAGRMVVASDVVSEPATIALIDAPDMLGQASSEPVLLLAASAPGSGWKARGITLTVGGRPSLLTSARRKTVMGNGLSVLARGEPYLVDEANGVDVELIDRDQWLTSCDDEALVNGGNLAVLGNELIQFGRATPLGDGCFRLERLLRGRGGSEWAAGGHSIGDIFVLIEPDSVQPASVPAWAMGSAVEVEEKNAAAGASVSVVMSGESLRPPSPVGLGAAVQPDGSLLIHWTRRSRRGWGWIDDIDAPLAESKEQYRVTVTGSASTTELTVFEPQVAIDAGPVLDLGLGAFTIEVRQIGDCAASRAATLSITI